MALSVSPTMGLRHRRGELQGLVMRWLCLVGVVAMLSGCAATSITSQVQSYGQWPQGRAPGTFVFDVLPSQQVQQSQRGGQADPVSMEALQAAALPVLQANGFTLVPPDQADRADLLVQLVARSKLEPRTRYGGFGGFYGHPFGHPYGHPFHPYGFPHGRIGWGGPVFLWSPAMEPPWATLRVEVIVRDRRSSQVLYETHASHDRLGSVDPSVLPYLFEAALRGFPDTPPGPRMVDVPLPEKAR